MDNVTHAKKWLIENGYKNLANGDSNILHAMVMFARAVRHYDREEQRIRDIGDRRDLDLLDDIDDDD